MIKRLEIIRVVTALIVLVGHLRSIFLPPLDQYGPANFLIKGLYFITGFGHQAVLVFFVISGYLVGGRYLKSDFSTLTEIRKRVLRIYPVFIIAVLLSIILSNGHHSLYNLAILLLGVGEILDIELANNLPLWSLSYELTYYVLFAFLFSGKWVNRLCGAVFACAIAFYAIEVLAYSLFWLLGACLRFEGFCKTLRRFKKGFLFSGVVALLLVRFYRGEMSVENYALNLVVVVSFCAFLADSLFRQELSSSLKWLGRLSYPLYAVHYPILIYAKSDLHCSVVFAVMVVFSMAILLLSVETKFLRWVEKSYKRG